MCGTGGIDRRRSSVSDTSVAAASASNSAVYLFSIFFPSIKFFFYSELLIVRWNAAGLIERFTWRERSVSRPTRRPVCVEGGVKELTGTEVGKKSPLYEVRVNCIIGRDFACLGENRFGNGARRSRLWRFFNRLREAEWSCCFTLSLETSTTLFIKLAARVSISYLYAATK